MITHLRANLWLLVLTVLLCSVLYPLLLLGIGQTVFPDKAQGSLLTDAKGNPVGSRLIAQPFSQDQFFQPRPSAASYNAAASGASNLSGSNYQLRDQVVRRLGPIVKYQGGPKVGQLVAPDVESWFQKDQFDGKAGIVAQWANLHNASAQNWIKNDMSGTRLWTQRQVRRRVAEVAQGRGRCRDRAAGCLEKRQPGQAGARPGQGLGQGLDRSPLRSVGGAQARGLGGVVLH